jgi:23S rRNA (adenine2503-C2)-methyltransferase
MDAIASDGASRAPLLFKDHTSLGIHERLASLGVSARLARRLQAAVLQRPRGEVPMALPEVPRRVLEAVRQHTGIPRLALLEKVISPTDGFAKYLFQGDGPEPFETVRIPLLHRSGDEKYIVCVSSQVGCAMGCAFCATAKMGFRRNLAAWEIVDQVIQVRDDSDYPVRGVVMMGMGEPITTAGKTALSLQSVRDRHSLFRSAHSPRRDRIRNCPVHRSSPRAFRTHRECPAHRYSVAQRASQVRPLGHRERRFAPRQRVVGIRPRRR